MDLVHGHGQARLPGEGAAREGTPRSPSERDPRLPPKFVQQLGEDVVFRTVEVGDVRDQLRLFLSSCLIDSLARDLVLLCRVATWAFTASSSAFFSTRTSNCRYQIAPLPPAG